MDSLYKFSNLNINKIAFLATNKMWFSSFDDFNDPFEGCINIEKKCNSIRKIKQATRNFLEIYSEMSDDFYETFENKRNYSKEEINDQLDIMTHYFHWELESLSDISACCFIGMDKNIVNNQYMWSHYADGLRGYCIKFDRKSLIESLIKNNEDLYLGAVDVCYSDIIPNINIVDFYYLANKHLNSNNIHINGYYANKIKIYEALATKSKHWEVEREVRLLSRGKKPLYYDGTSIKEIILGEKMPQEQQELVKKIILSINDKIIIKKARTRHGEYSIDVL